MKDAARILLGRTLPRLPILFLAAAAILLQTRQALSQITVDLSIKRTI
ncbi:MAG: hypothetical protein RLZZ408_4, partial [Verrucomicrobiota bacterium]